MTTRGPEGRDVVIGAPATFVDRVRPDGVIVRWESRYHRKHQKPAVGSTWWAPKARGWWIAVLFAIGSVLFAAGSVPGYASAAGAVGDTVTYRSGEPGHGNSTPRRHRAGAFTVARNARR